ncbi:MAG TPA: UDP-4-amino-4,6-dideoxy-N-acetyl-beta-L-altrosamine transaminase [Cyclobacteriaceae bacterium]|nr:UDP-4-amino-4,6-dideoxy-N-acetyl-beta-L-altrosamine transaminase [Cyclobacteriaceae bacterium]
MEIIPYGKQHITEADITAVVAALKGEYLTQGPTVQDFEKKFAAYVGATYAVAVANGTAALHLSAMALEVNATSNVITTPITFAASANCVRYCGGSITFADIDPNTALLDISRVRELLQSSPPSTYQGIIPVDFAGYPVNLEAFRDLADEFGLWIIEDACHAPGADFTDRAGIKQRCGNGKFADLAIFSFHPVKHIACGEGGMITTNNGELYEKLLLLRTHGISRSPERMHENHGGWYYEMLELGFNYRLTDIQSALGISQLVRADEGLLRRRQLAARYDKAFRNTPVRTIASEPSVSHAYHLYVIRVQNRKLMYDYLRSKGIYAQVHYIPVHQMPYYQGLGYKKGSMPFAEAYYEECLSLPMYPALTDAEQDRVVNEVLEGLRMS